MKQSSILASGFSHSNACMEGNGLLYRTEDGSVQDTCDQLQPTTYILHLETVMAVMRNKKKVNAVRLRTVASGKLGLPWCGSKAGATQTASLEINRERVKVNKQISLSLELVLGGRNTAAGHSSRSLHTSAQSYPVVKRFAVACFFQAATVEEKSAQ